MIGARLRRLHRDEEGLSGGAEALVFGVLVFLVGTLIALNAWAVVDAEMAANAAAREAARAVAETTAPTWGDALDAATAVARMTLEGHGKDPDDAAVGFAEGPGGADLALPPQRCTRVTLLVTYPVPAVEIPIVGRWVGVRQVTGVHSELVDPLRSGLTGTADCV